MASKARLKRTVVKSFKAYGVALDSGALSRILQFCAEKQAAIEHDSDLISDASSVRGSGDFSMDSLIAKLSELTVAQPLKIASKVTVDDLEPVLDRLNSMADPIGGDSSSSKQDCLDSTSVFDESTETAISTSVALSQTGLLELMDAFSMDRFTYNRISKAYVREKGPFALHGTAEDHLRLFLERYEILRERTLRNEKFQKSSLRRVNEHSDRSTITTTMMRDEEMMVGGISSEMTSSMRGHPRLVSTSELVGMPEGRIVWLFGMLSELGGPGKLHLQDPNGSIELRMHESTELRPGLYTWGCVVICEGCILKDRSIKVLAMGHPMYDPRESVIRAHRNLDCVPFEQRTLMKSLESSANEDMFVILSNVHLDSKDTMEYLSEVLRGFDQLISAPPPTLFILMGNFSRQILGSNPRDMRVFRSLFESLAQLIAVHTRLVNQSSFVFIPGPKDPCNPGNVLPYPCIPPVIQSVFSEDHSNIQARFLSNPCRIRFGTQMMVFFRENLLQTLRRKCVVTPELASSEDLSEHLIQTVLDQSHLCPLPLSVRPVYWAYDHALRLYPAPDLLVLADSHDEYDKEYYDVRCVCPGDFYAKGRFLVYYPATKEVDFSEVKLNH